MRNFKESEKNRAGKNILFVCSANINRSPTAELWFSVRNPENIYESAGSNQAACNIRGGKYVLSEQLRNADRIICMEERNLREIENVFGSGFSEKIEVASIPDCYGFLEISLIFAIIDNILID
jgi:predicted protein tyrosine phosphatase